MTHDFMMRNVYKPPKPLPWENRNHYTSHYRYRFHHSNTRPATYKDTYYHEDVLNEEQWKERVKPKKAKFIAPGSDPNGASQSELTKTQDNVIPFFYETPGQKRRRLEREAQMKNEDNPFDLDEKAIRRSAPGTLGGMEKWIASKLKVCFCIPLVHGIKS